jgi:hypothetical protein
MGTGAAVYLVSRPLITVGGSYSEGWEVGVEVI